MSAFKKLAVISLTAGSLFAQSRPAAKAEPKQALPARQSIPVAAKPVPESNGRWDRMKQRDEEIDRMLKDAARQKAAEQKNDQKAQPKADGNAEPRK